MPFVNEAPISEADIEKYSLRTINASYGKNSAPYYWTIDRERDIYLRMIQYGGNDYEFKQASFSFYWKGREIPVYLWLVKCESEGRQSATIVWRMNAVGSDKSVQWLPATQEPYRAEIIADLKEALVVRKGLVGTDEYRICETTFEF